MATSQLFIYYRIPKAEIALGLACAQKLMVMIAEQGLGRGELLQREEADKPYFTLMEIIYPTALPAAQAHDLCKQLDELAAQCFSPFETPPNRHTEVFTPCV